MFSLCACTHMKQVPGYKETELYIWIYMYMYMYITCTCACTHMKQVPGYKETELSGYTCTCILLVHVCIHETPFA